MRCGGGSWRLGFLRGAGQRPRSNRVAGCQGESEEPADPPAKVGEILRLHKLLLKLDGFLPLKRFKCRRLNVQEGFLLLGDGFELGDLFAELGEILDVGLVVVECLLGLVQIG